MTIIYALVSRQQTVLAENTSTNASGNFPTVTRVLLEKIPQQDEKMTLVHDDYVFHYIVENGICYMCMSDEKNKHRIPFAFLEDMKDRFLAQFGLENATQAIAFSMNEDFKGTIAGRMEYFNSDEADRAIDNIGNVKNQIEEVKENMVQNIERVLERGERIELLVDRADELTQQAFRFESTGRTLRRHMYWRQIQCRAMIGFAVVFIIYFASISMCGFKFQYCKSS